VNADDPEQAIAAGTAVQVVDAESDTAYVRTS
jgi:hypothetical protein